MIERKFTFLNTIFIDRTKRAFIIIILTKKGKKSFWWKGFVRFFRPYIFSIQIIIIAVSEITRVFVPNTIPFTIMYNRITKYRTSVYYVWLKMTLYIFLTYKPDEYIASNIRRNVRHNEVTTYPILKMYPLETFYQKYLGVVVIRCSSN